jgi:capsular polysaccharide biosynthesis protein
MRERLIRSAIRLYPASWRRRYGVEFAALLDDAGRDWSDVLDVLLGALKMQTTTWSFGKLAAGFAVAGALLCGALSYLAMPDKYTSDAVLRLQTAQAVIPGNAERFVITLMQNTLGRSSLIDIMKKQNLYTRERTNMPLEDVVERMRHDISFERLGNSEAFHVRFRYGNAQQAQRSEQELIDSLIAASVSMRRADRIGAHSYDLEVLDPASLPKRPSSPNRFLIASFGLAAGLLLAGATAAVRARSATDPA